MSTPTIHIRSAHEGDAAALARLAQLDSRPVPALPALLAMVDGEPVAALGLATGDAVADPFRPTAGVLRLLELQAGGGHAPARRSRLAGALRRTLATPSARTA